MQKQNNKTKSRNALGQGLSSLLGADTSVDNTTGGKKFLYVDIGLITTNHEQPRKKFDDNAIEELANSIRQHGVISPIIVNHSDGHYRVVAGERRLRAAKIAGLASVPVVLQDLPRASSMMEYALVENIQREDLTPIEEARGYHFLIDRYGYTQEQLSSVVGKSRSHISNMMRLLNLPDEVISMIDVGELSMGHARAIIKAPDPVKLAHDIVKKSLSVRQAEKMLNKADQKVSVGECLAEDFSEIEQMLSKKLGCKVTVGVTSLTIKYDTMEELDSIISRLL